MMSSSQADVEPLSREELETRLLRAAEKGSEYVPLFAARCALRIIPFLTIENGFDYWPGREQAHCVMALWSAATGILGPHYNLNYAIEDPVPEVLRIVHAAYAVNASCKMFPDVSGVVSRACDAAAYARYAPYTDDDAYSASFQVSLRNDLLLIESENPQELLATPLWKEMPRSAAYDQQLKDWFNALQVLASVERSPNNTLALLLEQIVFQYDDILQGKYSQEKMSLYAQQIKKYFESIYMRSEENWDEPISAEAGVESKSDKSESPAQKFPPIFKFSPTRRQSPEEISTEDHLNRQQLVDALSAILAAPENSEHQTLGLLGEWGAGKSTWLGFLKAALCKHENQPYLFSTFNAWAYEHTANLQAGIAHEMIRALVEPPVNKNILERWWWSLKLKSTVAVAIHGWSKILGLLFRFLAAIVPFSLLAIYFVRDSSAPDVSALSSVLTIGAGFLTTLFLIQQSCAEQWKTIWASPQAKELLTYLKLPDYAKHLGEIPLMRKTLEKFCHVRLTQMDNKNTRFLLVVDDLDRCSHQCIVKVFEAVRLVLDIKNVTVIIAVDQHIALAALALHYKDLAAHHKLTNSRAIARDYLAKVIHLPITLSAPASDDVENFLQKMWVKASPEIVTKDASHAPLTEIGESSSPAQSLPEVEKTTRMSNPLSDVDEVASSDDQQNRFVEVEPNDVKNLKLDRSASTPLIGLSPTQKKAFVHWAHYFKLSNPRQLKRLNNTYSLLLNANVELEQAIILSDSESRQAANVDSYPILITLIAIEYLNALEDSALRKNLKSYLQGMNQIELDHPIINKEFISLFERLKEASGLDLIKIVEPFVLPAIECDLPAANHSKKLA